MSIPNARRGRPLKFSRPARTVALTLPEDVIASLSTIDPDLSRAVVRLALPLPRDGSARSRAEVTSAGNRAVLVVPPDKALAALAGVELLPLADGRCLISLDADGDVAVLELQLRDGIEDDTLPPESATLFAEVADVLRTARKTRPVRLRRIMVLSQTRR